MPQIKLAQDTWDGNRTHVLQPMTMSSLKEWTGSPTGVRAPRALAGCKQKESPAMILPEGPGPSLRDDPPGRNPH